MCWLFLVLGIVLVCSLVSFIVMVFDDNPNAGIVFVFFLVVLFVLWPLGSITTHKTEYKIINKNDLTILEKDFGVVIITPDKMIKFTDIRDINRINDTNLYYKISINHWGKEYERKLILGEE